MKWRSKREREWGEGAAISTCSPCLPGLPCLLRSAFRVESLTSRSLSATSQKWTFKFISIHELSRLSRRSFTRIVIPFGVSPWRWEEQISVPVFQKNLYIDLILVKQLLQGTLASEHPFVQSTDKLILVQ